MEKKKIKGKWLYWFTFAILFDIVSTAVCCASIPVAADHNDLTIFPPFRA